MQKSPNNKPPKWAAAVFFLLLGVLALISFVIPLRPQRSYSEKRELAKFPEFSFESLFSGDYFSGISLWFSDTFPGREGWITLSDGISQLHGVRDVAVSGEQNAGDPIPTAAPTVPTSAPTVPPTTVPPTTAPAPTETRPPETEPETVPPPETEIEEWGGINAGEEAEAILGSVIQIGDTAFNAFTFSRYYTEMFVESVNSQAEKLAERGIRVVSAPVPSAVGVLLKPDYQEQLKCSDEVAVMDYVTSLLNEKVYPVNLVSKLVPHNSEYLYFRTDHHWTALGAYYCYEGICQVLDMEPVPLADFTELDQGEYCGTVYGKAPAPSKLRLDNVMSYLPPMEIEFHISQDGFSFFDWPMISDLSARGNGSKYMCFLAGDNPLSLGVNEALPEGKNCLLIKDSCGNPLVPFLTQNYHKVYAVDYRSYGNLGIAAFCDKYQIDDVIFSPMLIMVQGEGANKLIRYLCR